MLVFQSAHFQIGYYLDESRAWGLEIAELQHAVDEARKHCIPRAIVVINPGNPTGVQHTCPLLSEDILLLRRFCSFCEN